MIHINGRVFAKNTAEGNRHLINHGGTVTGFYKIRKRGILFLNIQNKPFLYLCRNNPAAPFFVSCSEVEHKGKMRIWYSYSTCSLHEKIIGLDALSYMQQHELCRSIHETADEANCESAGVH